MSKNNRHVRTRYEIDLKICEARHTRAQKALDGTRYREQVYQDAKKDLAEARALWRANRPRVKDSNGNGVAYPATLAVKSTDPRR